MIRSVRYGFATNSSSSHSVILHSAADRLAGLNTPIEQMEENRDNYVLTSRRDKLIALMHANAETLRQISGHEMMRLIGAIKDYGVEGDPQSLLAVKLPFETPNDMAVPAGVPLGLWVAFMLDPLVAVYGYGQDQEEDVYDDAGARTLDRWSSTIWKVDGDALVSFSRSDGSKMRWSKTPYEKSSAPELVDVKITDFCGYGCKFCYQGSTKAGAHAPLPRIEAIFEHLASMGVFEVAIGGGEPAHHPEFDKIVRAAARAGLTLNFTAFGSDWTKNAPLVDALFSEDGEATARGIGVSVHSARDLVKLDRIRDGLSAAGVKPWRANLISQSVIGATPMKATMALAKQCMEDGKPLLLLGYKTTGRGASFTPRMPADSDIRDLLLQAQSHIEQQRQVSSYDGFHLSVDTAFLDAYGHVLDDVGIPQALRSSPEGKFSMYIDAVENTCGPSSYCDPAMMAQISDIKAQFAAW